MEGLSSQALPNGHLLNQKFQIVKELGSGAFGITYLVKHVHFESQHVVKEYLPEAAVRHDGVVVPRTSSDKEIFNWGLSRFFEEATLLHRLNHPNVVKVTDLFKENGTAYFVMPYLGSNTLEDWMSANPNPSEDLMIATFIPLLEGLKYIHDQGVLHRDIKPVNILIAQDGKPVLIDFGSARNAIGKKSKIMTRVLTPHFAPIEQYSTTTELGEPLDLYSLAASMYQVLTGDYPPVAIDRITNDMVIPLANTKPYTDRYSQHFLAGVDKNLSLHAKDRDQNATEMQNHLLGYDEAKVQEQAVFDAQEKQKFEQEQALWDSLVGQDTIESYRHYLSIYPVGRHAKQAQEGIQRIIQRQEDDEWLNAQKQDTIAVYSAYLDNHPEGRYASLATSKIKTLKTELAQEKPKGSDDKAAAIPVAQQLKPKPSQSDASKNKKIAIGLAVALALGGGALVVGLPDRNSGFSAEQGTIWEQESQFVFDTVYDFSEDGIALAKTKDGQWVYIDQQGSQVESLPEGTVVKTYSEGVTIIEDVETGKWIYRTNDGQEHKADAYDEILPFSQGLARVSKKSGDTDVKYGFVDHQGREVIPVKYTASDEYFSNDGKVAVAEDKEARHWHFVDTKNKKSDLPDYDYINSYGEGVFAVRNENQPYHAYITAQGKRITDFIYEETTRFDGGVAVAKLPAAQDGYYHIIDRQGKVKAELSNDRVGLFYDGMVAFSQEVQGEPKYGFMDAEGRIVIPAEYDSVGRFSNGMAWVERNQSYAYISNSNQLLDIQTAVQK